MISKLVCLASTASAFAISDAFKSVQQICSENGYLYEEHQVVTQDGYILEMMRIPGIKNKFD